VTWQIEYLKEAVSDLERLDNSVRKQVLKAISKVATNPLPSNEGGYGKPLGNMSETKLAGLLKIKLRSSGIRIVYALVRQNGIMRVLVISLREDNLVYKIANRRYSS